MTFKSTHKWSSGPEIDASIDRTIFELQVKDYTWTKALSIKPRKCYWTNDIISPFSYAMVAEIKLPLVDNAMDQNNLDDEFKRNYPVRWVAMSTFVYLRLQGKL